jgi:hypothetical protein
MIRNRLEVTHNRENFSTLNLFCTWCVHTVITDSLTGLRTLVRVNNAVSKVIEKEKLGQLDGLIQDIVAAIGVKTLRAELIAFLDAVGIAHRFGEEEIWAAFMTHLIEIIRDTPIKFRPVAEIEAMSKWKGAAKIYKQIVETPFWRDNAVVSITVSDLDLAEAMKARGKVPDEVVRMFSGMRRYLVIHTTNDIPMFVPFVWE